MQCKKELVKKDNETFYLFKKRKFCDYSCSATYLNLHKQLKDIPLKYCLYCGKELKKTSTKYCSSKCQVEYQYKIYIERWKQGLENGIKGKYGLSIYIRRYLLEKNNNKCCICGWNKINPYTNTTPLEIHHKDGNYANNKEDNLQVLCPSCHSLTSTYKSANKYGRKERQKYSN